MNKHHVVVFGLIYSCLVFGHGMHHDDDESAAVQENLKPTAWSRFDLGLDMRPSTSINGNSVFLDNEASLTYRANESLTVGYMQHFQIFLSRPPADKEGGPDFHEHQDGFLQASIKKIGTIGQTELSSENRIYLPTSSEKRDRGFLTAIGSFIKASIPITSYLSVFLADGPVLHVYSQSEYGEDNGLISNPFFENRFALGFDFSMFNNKLKVSLPIFWHEFFHYNSRGESKFKNQWSHAIWISPEISYALSQNSQVAISYHSENLLGDYQYRLALTEGLQGGTLQVGYQLKL